MTKQNGDAAAALYVQTNDATANAVLGFERGDDGRLVAIDADARKVFGWTLRSDGELVPVGAFDGVPDTVAGLAAS
jgi:hypothetical protein